MILNESGLVAHPNLPAMVKTLSGAVIDPKAKRWAFHDGLQPISMNFEQLYQYAAEELIESLKIPLVWYAENTDGKTVEGKFRYLKHFLKQMATAYGHPISVIDGPLLASFRATLTLNNEYKLGALSSFLEKWNDMGVLGVTDDAKKFLNNIRLKGNTRGAAVLTMDPHKGPLTNVERSAVQSALNDAFAAGKVSVDNYLLAWLCLLLGQRNIQFAMLKVCDLSEVRKSDGSREYVLKVPRAKQQSSEVRRDQFTERLITPSIGKMLVDYSRIVETSFDGYDVYVSDPSQAPLFPQKRNTRSARPDFHYHTTPQEIGKRVSFVFKTLKIYSERTGEPIKVGPKRLRHTIATSAAREGHGELIIAELLDHSDTQNVGVYVKATPEIVERIDRAVALRIAPLAHAFKGTVIQDESEALRGEDYTSRIVDPRFDEKMRPMGNCGRYGSCSFMAPIACYTCKNFQAWADGPHEAVLSFLVVERERLLKDTDERIATVNDRTILAVADAINQCRELRSSAGDA